MAVTFRGKSAVWRLLHVVAPRKPHLVNGIVCRVVSEKIATGNPLLPLLKVTWNPSGFQQPCDWPPGSSAIRHGDDMVKYAAVALSHLSKSGFLTVSVHLHRLLDILTSSRDGLNRCDPRILLGVLEACDSIVRASYQVLRRRSDTATVGIVNAVTVNSRKCALYICEHVGSTCKGEMLARFASVMYSLSILSADFTKHLLREINESSSFFSCDSLIGALRYVTNDAVGDQRGRMGAVYSLVDALCVAELSWRRKLEVLDCLVELDVTHMGFLDVIVSTLLECQEEAEMGIIGMDTIPSRDICHIIGALLHLGSEDVAVVTDMFVSRYVCRQRRGPKKEGIARDIQKCNMSEVLNLLRSIVATYPQLEGPAGSWATHIIQDRAPWLLARASLHDLEELFHVLSGIEPSIYAPILGSSSSAPWLYGVGRVNVTSLLISNVGHLGPKALAKAIMCYSLAVDATSRGESLQEISACIPAMCSAALAMLSRSSFITKTMAAEIELSGANDQKMIVCSVKAPPVASGNVGAIAADSHSRVLYDPSVTSNFKYLKRGDSRADGRNKAANKLYSSGDTVRNVSREGTALANQDWHNTTMEGHGNNELLEIEEDTNAPSANGKSSNSASEVLKVLREVHRSLCIYHHFGCRELVNPYGDLSLNELQTVKHFLMAHNHLVPVLSARFHALDDQYTLYGVDDGSYNHRILKAIGSTDSAYLDPRLMCTPDARTLRELEEDRGRRLRLSGAKLRNARIDVAHPPRSGIKLNWDHFDNAKDLGRAVHPREHRNAAVALRQEAERVSRLVDYRLHGRRDTVEYYEDSVSRRFRGGFACWQDSNGSTTATCTPDGISTSRLHKQVEQAVATVSPQRVRSEAACGPYHVDLNLVLEVRQLLLHGVRERLCLVARVDQLLALLVGLLERLSVLHHPLNLLVAEPAAALDRYLLLATSGLVHGADVHDAVSVHVEGDLDLRHAAGSRRDAHKFELAQHLVVRSHATLTLVDLDAHLSLVVSRSGEHLALLGGDGGVAVDESGEHAA
ncbi:glutamate dehydrogenase, putative [Babesia ovata]|uniref:Glutamate dehydrogenase, putative n=1 Tax=Babesia ovata TaxID=189622 RepID=A0A2H6KIH0_9APIC|nr:glutamate dehydrogenase, putative [Babesia ovata]GBE62794.1 glutamate dehydrogenase, putative [Babesia ovata]